MPTDESRLPLRPILPSQRPPTTRNRKGQFTPGVCGNPRGRPTNATLAAKLAARAATRDSYERIKRAAAYNGITPEQIARVARAVFGKFWKAEVARELMLSHQTIRRWAKGERKISLDNERLMLMLLCKRARHTHLLARSMHRRAEAAHRAQQAMAETPRYKRLTRPDPPRTEF